MVIYDPEAERSEGERPIGADDWFTRFTQRLVAALSAPTEEGDLFPVDMALRPSGSAGPIAVRLSRFESYYEDEAWTWERMALTRARVVTHDRLQDDLVAELERAIARDVPAGTIRTDAAGMRARFLLSMKSARRNCPRSCATSPGVCRSSPATGELPSAKLGF